MLLERPQFVIDLYRPFDRNLDPVDIDCHLTSLCAGELTLPYDSLVPLTLLIAADDSNEVFSEEEQDVIKESMANCFEMTMHPMKYLASVFLIKGTLSKVPLCVTLTLNWLKGSV